MKLTGRDHAALAVLAAVAVMSSVVGGAGHWFAAWVLVLAGLVVFVGWLLWVGGNRRRAVQDARAELERVRVQQRVLRSDIDRARSEARAVQQEARADLELLRAEVAVASDPTDPEDRSGR